MCRPSQCSICSKSSWTGCGAHIEYAMSSIPKEEWCTCLSAEGVRGSFPPKSGTGLSSDPKQ